jgi:hypothetical protein
MPALWVADDVITAAKFNTTEQTTTLTGTQHDFAVTQHCATTHLRCNNASALTITGLKVNNETPKDGAVILVSAVGAGSVAFAHQNTGSTAAYRIVTRTALTVTVIPGAAAMLVYDATTQRWRLFDLGGGSMLNTYSVTLADAAASGDTTVASFTVPGNSWADGEAIVCRLFGLRKNNQGAPQSTLLKVNVTGGSAQTLQTVSWADSATEFKAGGVIVLFRAGNDIWVPKGRSRPIGQDNTNNDTPTVPNPQDVLGGSTASLDQMLFMDDVSVLTPTNFTSDILVSILVNLAVTHAAYYFKPKHAAAYKTPQWVI